ncbi:hypothetical protein BV898_08660 [Hypsibius exemplaris]|uniref:PAW domain-containing protein n=1 Tax=Hypsibius exemplaris TaxID=2072580 RepID=A0A1W0WPZ7_HYPEX|nr:hypothetical protein BV898_08660 [Hypsibius exemplaris]
MESCCAAVMPEEPSYSLEEPMTVASRRKKYLINRSKSDRRPSMVREWDGSVHRRTLSLYAKVSEKQRAATAAAETPMAAQNAFHLLNNVITPTDEEAAARKMEIKYSARTDEYRRPTNPNFRKEQGWNSLVFAERNMELVTEHRQMAEIDNVMVYLSRNPGTNSSYIQWKFDLSETGLRVDKFGLRFPYDTSEDGHVRVYLKPDLYEDDEDGGYCSSTTATTTDGQGHVPVFSSPVLHQIPEVQGWSRFSLVAELSCKRGACVFHHSQLFLQQRTPGIFEKDVKKYPFKVDISLA